MKAIIHIGMMKTGSSTIQKWLSFNRLALAADGVHSNKGMGMHWRALQHAIFVFAMRNFVLGDKLAKAGPREIAKWESICENYNSLTRQLEKLSRDPGIFIYSDEDIFECTEIQMAALDKFLSRFFNDRTYVVYIRNTVDFFLSMYSQKIQGNRFSTQEYSEFLKKCETDLVPYGLESSYENLFDWHEVIGDKLNVRLLEADWLVNGDLIEDFASLVGVAAIRKPGRRNISFSAEYIEYVRLLNQEFRNNLPHKIRKKAIRILKEMSFGKSKIAMSDTQAKSLRDIHSDQEEKICKIFFPEKPFLFSPKIYGCGKAPTPLTARRKVMIESEIRKKLEVWKPHELVHSGDRFRISIADRPVYWTECLKKSWWD